MERERFVKVSQNVNTDIVLLFEVFNSRKWHSFSSVFDTFKTQGITVLAKLSPVDLTRDVRR